MGLDITTGLPRVEELFEARVPKGQSVLSEIDGVVEITPIDDGYRIRITNTEQYRNEYPLPSGAELQVSDGDWVDVGTMLARPTGAEETESDKAQPPATLLLAPVSGRVSIEDDNVVITYEEKEEEEYVVPFTASIRVANGSEVRAGDQLTEGHVNPQDILRIRGREAVQRYLVDEIQKVYRSQGVTINDKHIECVARRMLQKIRVDSPGDTELLPGDLVDRFVFEDINARVVAEAGEPATAQTALLGITKAALNADSWLAAASFQETTRVLTEAAINGKVDRLVGLKENVIIGRLIPARSLKAEELAILQPEPLPSLMTEDEPQAAIESEIPEHEEELAVEDEERGEVDVESAIEEDEESEPQDQTESAV